MERLRAVISGGARIFANTNVSLNVDSVFSFVGSFFHVFVDVLQCLVID